MVFTWRLEEIEVGVAPSTGKGMAMGSLWGFVHCRGMALVSQPVRRDIQAKLFQRHVDDPYCLCTDFTD